MKDRFEDQEVKDLFDQFENVSNDEFINYLKLLQPEKKDWTEKKEKYWFKNGKPITGILSKLIGSTAKVSSSMKKRLLVIKEHLNLESMPKIKRELTDDEKVLLMMACLRDKYIKEPYKKILLDTGDSILHERPMRGNGDFWTYGGNDMLGKCLMQIRDEIRGK
jgi:hypothetical protein